MKTAAACRVVELIDEQTSARYPVVAFYPSEGLERDNKLGPYTAQVGMDAAILAGRFPFVVISHGSGGSHLAYRDLALHLARNGFVVAMPEHPGNNRNDVHLGGTAAILSHRPRQASRVIDWAFAEFG